MKKLLIGADPFPPYQYIDEAGVVQGSDYEVIQSIVTKLGYEAEFFIKDWVLIETFFTTRAIDILFQVQKTPEREKNHFFSKKLRDALTTIITSTENAETESIQLNDLKKGKLGLIKNYQYGVEIDSIDNEKPVYFASLHELIIAVSTKSIDFGVVDEGVFTYLHEKNNYQHIKHIDHLQFKRALYIAFNDVKLRKKFDRYL